MVHFGLPESIAKQLVIVDDRKLREEDKISIGEETVCIC